MSYNINGFEYLSMIPPGINNFFFIVNDEQLIS